MYVVCGACACCFSLMYLCVVRVVCCVMVYGLCLYVLRVYMAVSFNVLVCGVCGVLFDVAWFVVVWFVAVRDLLCGVVGFALFVCVLVLCVCALFVKCCVMVYGLSFFVFVFVCVFVFAWFECVFCVVSVN